MHGGGGMCAGNELLCLHYSVALKNTFPHSLPHTRVCKSCCLLGNMAETSTLLEPFFVLFPLSTRLFFHFPDNLEYDSPGRLIPN